MVHDFGKNGDVDTKMTNVAKHPCTAYEHVELQSHGDLSLNTGSALL